MRIARYVKEECPEEMLTEKQWKKEGFALKETAKGEVYWTNKYCQHQARYYKLSEVEYVGK